jgi:hypothetical protein
MMTIITIYSLFGDDVRSAAFNRNADDTFNVLTIIAMIAFSIEIVFACFAKDDYWLGFYFWLDLISTVSLITDISWVMDLILGTSDSGGATNAQSA